MLKNAADVQYAVNGRVPLEKGDEPLTQVVCHDRLEVILGRLVRLAH
ncbi:MAG: hypothetical protein ACREJ5_29345 [Geminicoccaceae bacterium]